MAQLVLILSFSPHRGIECIRPASSFIAAQGAFQTILNYLLSLLFGHLDEG